MCLFEGINKPGNKKRTYSHAVAVTEGKSAIDNPRGTGSLKETHLTMKSTGSSHKPGNKKGKYRYAVAGRKHAINNPRRGGSLKEPHLTTKSIGSSQITECRKDGKIIIDSMQPVPVKRRRLSSSNKHDAVSECLLNKPESRPNEMYVEIKVEHQDSSDDNVLQNSNDSLEFGTSRSSEWTYGLDQEMGEDGRTISVVIQIQEGTVPAPNKLSVPTERVPESTAFEALSRIVVEADVSCNPDDGKSNSLNGMLISSLN